ncbi:hypothetical protein FQZ97_1081030 [compost metagenome]
MTNLNQGGATHTNEGKSIEWQSKIWTLAAASLRNTMMMLLGILFLTALAIFLLVWTQTDNENTDFLF